MRLAMRRFRRHRLVPAALVAFFGCGYPRLTDRDGGGPVSCMSGSDCPAMAPVCDTHVKFCVECTDVEHAACTGDSPICRADEHCHACNFHDECSSSKVCLPTGACANAADVAYVSSSRGTDNVMCTLASPCTSIMTALGARRPYTKLSGSFDEAVNINAPSDSKVVILADAGASLTRSGAGNILVVDGNSNVEIYDLAINGAADLGAGVSLSPGANQTVLLSHVSMSGNIGRGGAVAAFGGTIIINRSLISSNRGGGISISMAQFDVENNLIVGNGDDQSIAGGILLDKIAPGKRILNFNTISANVNMMGVAPGVSCINTVTLDAQFSSNIVYGNGISGTGTQVDTGHCSWTYSDIGPVAISGQGNVNVDPLFVNASGGDFHLTATSPVIDKADPAATLNVDIDGDIRPQGPNRDIGADEYKR